MNQNGFYLTIVSVYFDTEIHQICEFLNFCFGVAHVSVLLVYDAVPLGNCFQTCHNNVVVSFSMVKMKFFLYFLTLEYETIMLSCNFGN